MCIDPEAYQLLEHTVCRTLEQILTDYDLPDHVRADLRSSLEQLAATAEYFADLADEYGIELSNSSNE